MAETIRQLREDHATMARLLDLLERRLAGPGSGRKSDTSVIRSVLDYCSTYPAFCHHRKENLVLDKLRERDVRIPLAVGRLEEDHEALTQLTQRFLAMIYQVLQGEEAAGEAFTLLGQDFIDTYRDHMDMEEELFFPTALDALIADDWREIDAQVTDPDDRFFGKRAKAHFESMLNSIFASDRSGRLD